MEKVNKKSLYLKLFACVLLALAVFGAFAYILIKGDIAVGGAHNILQFCIVSACFVFSVLFIGKSFKKICIIGALGANVAANYFLLLNPLFKDAQLIAWSILCGMQFFLLLYTVCICKGVGLKILNLALRVALCLVAWFVLPQVLTTTLNVLAWISLMCTINCAVSALCLLFGIKKNRLLFLGVLLLLASYVFTLLASGWALLLGASTKFLEFLVSYPLAFYLFVPALYLIAISTAWLKKSE